MTNKDLKKLKKWAIDKWGEDRYEKRKTFIKAKQFKTYKMSKPVIRKAHYISRNYIVRGWQYELIKLLKNI